MRWLVIREVDDYSDELFALILGRMAYPFMFIFTIIMCLSNKSLQNVIPGHPMLSFLVLACGAMMLTFLLGQFVMVGAAFSALCCMIMLCVLFALIMYYIKPDSVQYFVLVTVIFSAIAFPLCFYNLRNGSGRIQIRWISCIVAGILNMFTAALYTLVIRSMWEDYRFPEGNFGVEDKILQDSIVGNLVAPKGFASASGEVVFYIVLAAICLGAFVATIIFRDKID